MRYYKVVDTGEIWSEEEIRQNYEMFREESEYTGSFDSFEDYLEDQLARGRSGGLTPIWFAVTSDNYDAWDNGSLDLDEAKEMLREQGCGLIAVIDESDNFCLDEIRFEDLD